MKNFLFGVLMLLSVSVTAQVYQTNYVASYVKIGTEWIFTEGVYQNNSFMVKDGRLYWQTPTELIYCTIISVETIQNSDRTVSMAYQVTGGRGETFYAIINTDDVSLVRTNGTESTALIFKIIYKI